MDTLHAFCLVTCFVFAKGGNICKVPNGETGECKAISKCPPFNDLNKKLIKTEDEDQFLRQSMCPSSSYIIKVCCPYDITRFKIQPVDYGTISKETTSTQHPKPNPMPTPKPSSTVLPLPITLSRVSTKKPNVIDKTYNNNGGEDKIKENLQGGTCGIDSSSGNKIFGGTATSIDQYPWLVLLEYSGGYFLCGGSLITSRLVLTAAHCVNGHSGPPSSVRLSEYNTTSYPTDYVETDGGGFDSSTVTIIPVQAVMAHPDHNLNKRLHDIGIVKMQTNAIFSDFIKIICLPTVDLLSRFNRKTNFTVAGWGRDESGESSDVKKHVMLPYVDNDYCRSRYPHLPLTNVVCAGGQKGKDSCNGDSGGPLMYELDQSFFVIGILSFGHVYCGLDGWPSVYTDVSKYVAWITNVIDGTIAF